MSQLPAFEFGNRLVGWRSDQGISLARFAKTVPVPVAELQRFAALQSNGRAIPNLRAFDFNQGRG